MPHQEVTYTIDDLSDAGWFTIPQSVRKKLGIADDEYPPLHIVLTVVKTNQAVFEDDVEYQMVPEPRIVDPRLPAILDTHQEIRVSVSLAELKSDDIE